MIAVQPVTNWLQFESCLELRFSVYSELGFVLPDSGCDLDAFDWSSIHFIAMDEKQVAGTVRLIIAGGDDLCNTPGLRASKRWFLRFKQARGANTRKLTSLPIVETIRDNFIAESTLRARRPAELSRIIVAPEFRGLGVSRLLSEAVVEKARDLRRDVLFLQCLPDHVGLFKKFGFQPMMQSLNYRLLIVPDRVVAMQMELGASCR